MTYRNQTPQPNHPIHDRSHLHRANRATPPVYTDHHELEDDDSHATNWELIIGQIYALADSFIQRERIIQEDPTITMGSYLRQRSGLILAVTSPFIVMGLVLFIPLILEASTLFMGPKNYHPHYSNEDTVAAVVEQEKLLSPIFTPEVQRWESLIVAQSTIYNIDPNAVATIMQIESCGDPYAQSSVGAAGLFQVMPFHFEPHENIFDPTTNARRGIAYLSAGIDIMDGSVGRAMAGYNGGHSVALQDSSNWADETRQYYYWASGIYEDAKSGVTSSARLQEWLQAGGESLCSQAALRNIGAFD